MITAADYITFEQFLDDPTIDEHHEWVDGKVVPMHAVADGHDAVTRWLNELLGFYVRHRRLGRLLGEPFVMKLDDPPVGRSPDLMFVATDHLDRIRANYLDGPADLVIEVLSPGTRVQDCVHKFGEYERGGVPEYWIVDPDGDDTAFHRRDDSGRFQAIPLTDGIYRPEQWPEASIDPAWFTQMRLPDPFDLWRQWGVL